MAKCRIDGTVCETIWLNQSGDCRLTIEPHFSGPHKECLYKELGILSKKLATAEGKIEKIQKFAFTEKHCSEGVGHKKPFDVILDIVEQSQHESTGRRRG